MRNKISYPVLLVVLFLLAFGLNQCNKTKSCPEGNLCVEGNILEYQFKPTSAKLILEVPEGSVGRNSAVVITDLVPSYPANADYGDFDRHFAGGLFNIEPHDLPFNQLFKLSIEYPGSGIFDDEGNNYESELRLWYIDEDESWSIVPSSEVDMDNDLVFAWVKRLGIYGVGAPKECIVGEWRVGDTLAEYPYEQRIFFNIDGSGRREFIYECGPGVWQESGENFDWEFISGQLSIHNFTERTVCDTISFTTPDTEVNYDCSGPTLYLEDIPPVTYFRFLE